MPQFLVRGTENGGRIPLVAAHQIRVGGRVDNHLGDVGPASHAVLRLGSVSG